MENTVLGEVLIELADLSNCVSNDFHCMHFNFSGAEFDTMHKEVLKEYYEQSAEDYDELNEKARMYGVLIPNASGAAERIQYQGIEVEGALDKGHCCLFIEDILETYIGAMETAFRVFNANTHAKGIGIANYLAGRLEYWTKEKDYFNRNREAI